MPHRAHLTFLCVLFDARLVYGSFQSSSVFASTCRTVAEGAGWSEVERRQLDFALQYNEMVDKLLPPPPSAYVKPEWMSEELWTALRQKHQFYHSSKREEYEMKKRECRKLVKRDRGV